MSKKIEEYASTKIETKKKRAHVWPIHATRPLCEQAITSLICENLVKQFITPDQWRIHSSIEARGKGFQHERKLWVENDFGTWHVAMIRYHAHDPTKTARGARFEEFFFLESQFLFLPITLTSYQKKRRTYGGSR